MIFDILNDDCQLHVIKYLDLKGQVAVKELSQRLNDNVRYYWRHQDSYCLNFNIKEFQTDEQFLEFLEQLNVGIRTLNLRNVATLRRILACHNFQFTNVRNLIYYIGYDNVTYYEGHDLHLELVPRAFPALNSLTLFGYTSGKYLTSLRNLTELNLNGCLYMDSHNLERIFMILPLRKFSLLHYSYRTALDSRIMALVDCKTLEELTIDDHHMVGPFCERLLRMPRLRKLTFWTRRHQKFLLRRVVEYRANDVHTLVCNESVTASEPLLEQIVMLPNLRRFLLQEDSITNMQLKLLGLNCKRLEELQLRRLPCQMGEMIITIIAYFKSLKILDVSNTTISMRFLAESQRELKGALDLRKEPLEFHYRGSRLNSFDIARYLNHPMLTAKNKSVFPIELKRNMLQLELQPLES